MSTQNWKTILNVCKSKKRSVKALVRKLDVNGKESCHQAKINDKIKTFLGEVFKFRKARPSTDCSNILSFINRPCLTNE